jgi:hypothetical protein
MLARTTTVQADIEKIDAGIAYVRDEVFPAVSAMSGCIGMSLLADRTSGRCIATTAWESEAAARDSADKVLSLRAGAIEALGSDTSEVDVWEIAVVHRDHAAPDGACARVTWLSGTPDTAGRAVDFYKMGVLPRLQDLDGFCSASFMINREAGRAVGTVTFETREQLEASRETARGLREAAARELGATIDDVAEMELAFAHLHIPEMV